MEDHTVLKDFIDDSIREIKDSIRKDLTKFRSMLEVLGGKATSFEPQNTVTNAKLWQFQGNNPEAWIVQAEHYFDFHKIKEDHKLNVASFYLDGEALKWYQWLFRNNQLIDWPHFADKDSLGESGLLFPSHTYVHPQWRNITNSLLSQFNGEQSECKSNTNAHKVFDESSDRHKDANSLCTFSKPIEFFITPNDLESYVCKIENSCGDDVENEDKNDEEEIVTIRNKPIEFVIANANKPSFWINSIVSTTYDLSMLDICKALDDHWNQLFAYPVGLAQLWEEMPSISYTFNYAKLMSKVTNDGRNWNYVGYSIILSLDMRPELWMVRRWNSQKVDHQQLFEIFEQEHEHVLGKWTIERCGKYRWVEDWMLEVAYHNVVTMMNHINEYISVLTKNEMEATLSLEFLSVCIDVFPITVYANVDKNVIFDIALFKWLLIYFLQRIDQEDKEDTILVKATFNTYPGLNKFAIIISILFYPNLEDKVLIEDGSIVVNQVDFYLCWESSLFHSAIPSNGPECEDAESKHETALRQKKGKSLSHSPTSTNLAERSASSIF
ncbi:hypothetical protein KY289_008288 [Solanum tuberosum]|nr:hypothetical protein KY289_008288 [Solanum tuberosum]